jgi:hypothetical protein
MSAGMVRRLGKLEEIYEESRPRRIRLFWVSEEDGVRREELVADTGVFYDRAKGGSRTRRRLPVR